MLARNLLGFLLTSLALFGCANKPLQVSNQHIQQSPDLQAPVSDIPEPIKRSVVLPPPKPTPRMETYSVVVTNVPAQEILFALARDAKINLDIHSGIQGNVTLNAINQTLPQILTRIASQVDMRYEFENGNLTVMPDTPYLHNYKIDYLNITRDSESTVTNSAQVTSTGSNSAGGTTGGGNNSTSSIKDVSKNRFWETLVQNIKDILHETDKIIPAGSSETSTTSNSRTSGSDTSAQTTNSATTTSAGTIENSPNPVSVESGGATVTKTSTFREAASVIANPENGIITVRATSKQQARIQEFIDQVMGNAHRQVLIEATIAEVTLNNQYQQGINWTQLIRANGSGFRLSGSTLTSTGSISPSSLGLLGTLTTDNIDAQLALLQTYGNVKVLSSPKLSVLNNQTAMMRVVDNRVYFTIAANTTTNQTSSVTTFTTTPNTISVGFTMSVTPQISGNDNVLLNLRPSITRILGFVNDPNPNLANPCGAGVANCNVPPIVSEIPELQTREMESLMRIGNRQIAVMGGLMQDSTNNKTDSIPGLSNVPLVGELFKQRDDTKAKTELVIFLRPIIIKNASLEGDFSSFRDALPDQGFFKSTDNIP